MNGTYQVEPARSAGVRSPCCVCMFVRVYMIARHTPQRYAPPRSALTFAASGLTQVPHDMLVLRLHLTTTLTQMF